MGQGRAIDWSKAGTRLRHTTPTPAHGGRNPDWNWVASRWKTAQEYAGEELTIAQVVDAVACPVCNRFARLPCRDVRGRDMSDGPHEQRRSLAGALRVASGEFVL